MPMERDRPEKSWACQASVDNFDGNGRGDLNLGSSVVLGHKTGHANDLACVR